MATIPYPTAGAAHVELPLRRFDAGEYMAMAEAGVLASQQRVELIGGYVVEMSPANADHNYVIMQLTERLAPLLGSFKLLVQGTLSLDEQHVFDPDVTVLKLREPSYRKSLPTATDVALVIEVAGSSLDRDARVKLPVYANLGIQEYWIVDLAHETLVVHRRPKGGTYEDVVSYSGSDKVCVLAAPQIEIAMDEIFAS